MNRKNFLCRLFSFITSFAIMLYFMLPNQSIYAEDEFYGNSSLYSKNYVLTNNQAENLVAVAMAQKDKTTSQLGISGQWCVKFVSDCAKLAGISRDIIMRDASTSSLYSKMVKAGAQKVSTAQAGDILFYLKGDDSFAHTGIATSATMSLHGNISGKVYYGKNSDISVADGTKGKYLILRPKYVSNVNPNIVYDNINAGTYYIKNNSTGTYLSVDSAIAADKQNVSVADKSNSKAFQFKTTGGTEHYLYSMLDNNYVLNPYSDTPTAGTNVTLFKKVTDGTQIWGFEKANGGYIIRLKYNPNCVLAISGSNVQLATYTGAANQIWTLEKADVVLSSIKINEDSFCSIYENGSTFKPDGLTLTATYSDGSTKNITEGYTVGNVDLSTVGNSVLTVSYEGKTATADITVQDLFDGNGTAESPYLVNNASDLKMVADMTNNTAANNCYGHASYKQTADIDLSEYTNWTPIGVYINSNSVFNGSYNGDYYKISNLNVNYDKLYTGLFGRINSASQNAVVKNLSVSGEVSGTKGCVGGIIGETGYGATIENCDFTGTVRGLTLVGGITGKIQCGATITNCYANADITATSGDAGGIVGGILVGANNYSTDAKISNSYFAGKVSGTGIGGICGLQTIQTTKDCKITYTNNYYLNSAAAGGVAGAVQAGCTGLISSQLKTIAADLGSPFVDNADDTLNNGYPVFGWQIETSDEKVSGDANNDGAIDLKDVVMIRRSVNVRSFI